MTTLAPATKSTSLPVATINRVEEVRGNISQRQFFSLAVDVLAQAVIRSGGPDAISDALANHQVQLIIDGTRRRVHTPANPTGTDHARRSVPISDDLHEILDAARGPLTTSQFIALAVAALVDAVIAYTGNGSTALFRNAQALTAAQHHRVRLMILDGAA